MNLEKIAKYQIWANDLVREKIEGLTKEEFKQEDIQDLCCHIILAIEWNTENIVNKKSVDWGEMYEELLELPKEKLLIKWKKTDEKLLKQVENIGDEMLEFPNFIKGEGIVEMTQEDFYSHYLTHTIYHRGQVMKALKNLGKEGVTTDYLFYLFALEEG
jgi:uncharacterized damage-inducible protein DinB